MLRRFRNEGDIVDPGSSANSATVNVAGITADANADLVDVGASRPGHFYFGPGLGSVHFRSLNEGVARIFRPIQAKPDALIRKEGLVVNPRGKTVGGCGLYDGEYQFVAPCTPGQM